MGCCDERIDWQAYVDGDLSLDQALSLESHLARCDDCRAELDRLYAVEEAVETWPLVDEPALMTERVMERVRRTRPVPPRFRLRWLDLGISLAGGGLLFAAMLFWRWLVLARLNSFYFPGGRVLEMLCLEGLLAVRRLLEASVSAWWLLLVSVVLAIGLVFAAWRDVAPQRRKGFFGGV